MQFIQIPGYEALLCRRVHKHLTQSDGLIPKFLEWMRLCGMNKSVKYNSTDKKATFPNGATLSFGYCDHEKDLDGFQGGRWHFIGIDELSQWKPGYYRYLFSRMRKAKESPVPIRMRAAGNPGGPAHEFIKKRFIAQGHDKFFVPSRLNDNPGIDAVDYVQSMNELDPMTRAQLLQGDWDAYEGGRFKKEWFVGKDGQRGWWIENRHGNLFYRWTDGPIGGVPINMAWIAITCDPASRAEEVNDFTAIGVFAVMPGGEILILEMVRERLTVENIVPRIAGLCMDYEPIFVGIENTGFQITLLNDARRTPGIPTVMPLEPQGKGKLVRATPAIIRASDGMIYFPRPSPMHPWVEDCLAELVQFTGDEKLDAHDDVVDILAYFVQAMDRGGLSMPSIITPEQAMHEAGMAGSSGAGGIFMG